MNLILNLVLNLAPCLLMLAVAWLAKKQFRSWLAPSSIFSLYWSAALLSVIILAPDFGFWYGAAWFVLLMAVCLHFGALVGGGLSKPVAGEGGARYTVHLRWGKAVLIAATAAGIVGAFILVIFAGFDLSALADPEAFFEVGDVYTSMRYREGQGPTQIYNIFNALLYLGAVYGGMWFALKKTWKARVWSLIPLGVGLLNAFLVSARTGFIWLLIFFVSGYMAMLVMVHRNQSFLTKRRIIQFAFIAVLLVFFVFAVQAIRHRENARETELAVLKTRVNIFGSPVVFSQWLRTDAEQVEPAWGARTFGGLADVIQGSARTQALGWEGIYLEVDGVGFYPNVYTAFRQLIEDATLPGSFVVMLAWGMISGKAYLEVLRGKSGWLPVLALFYGITLGSYLANWLNYNTLVLAWALLGVMVAMPGLRLIQRVFLTGARESLPARPGARMKRLFR